MHFRVWCSLEHFISGEKVCNKQWDFEARRRSSTCRDIAILFALHAFLPLLGASYVKWFFDSQSACKIIQVRGMRNDLHAIALEIFRFCADSSIHIVVQWILCTEIVSCL